VVKAKPKPTKTMSFKELVDLLSNFKHSNNDHYKLIWFIILTQMIDRAYFRVSTPPGFGKDSVVTICGSLFGDAATIVSPTVAKLEYRSNYKLLVVNEAVDIPKAEWKKVEQFLLDAGDFKPEIEKRSRSGNGTTETLNVKNFSVSLFYNDIDQYKVDPDLYFDMVTKEAVLNRFPALRLHGTYNENFNKLKDLNIPKFVEENFSTYKELIGNFTYYKQNMFSELHDYKVQNTSFSSLPERWRTSLNRLLRIVDMYSSSQEEFDHWVGVIIDSIDDYKAMIAYPKVYFQALKSLGEKKVLSLGVSHRKTHKEKNFILSQGSLNNSLIEKNDFWS